VRAMWPTSEQRVKSFETTTNRPSRVESFNVASFMIQCFLHFSAGCPVAAPFYGRSGIVKEF
jgi:hypothetical protein